jgi:hypothetical protein
MCALGHYITAGVVDTGGNLTCIPVPQIFKSGVALSPLDLLLMLCNVCTMSEFLSSQLSSQSTVSYFCFLEFAINSRLEKTTHFIRDEAKFSMERIEKGRIIATKSR